MNTTEETIKKAYKALLLLFSIIGVLTIIILWQMAHISNLIIANREMVTEIAPMAIANVQMANNITELWIAYEWCDKKNYTWEEIITG